MRYLLDTDTASDVIRNPKGRVAQRLAATDPGDVGIGILVAAELRFGVRRKGAPIQTQRVGELLQALPVLPLEPPMDAVYGELRARLEERGTPIGGNDLLIAAQALALGLTLVSGNVRELSRVEGLSVENWLV